jgi:hypothetical protein
MDDLTTDDIIDWLLNYASYEETEKVAKAIYSIYVQRRKTEYPELHIINKNAKKRINYFKPKKNNKKYRYPKGYRKYEKPLVQNKVVPITEYRK